MLPRESTMAPSWKLGYVTWEKKIGSYSDLSPFCQSSTVPVVLVQSSDSSPPPPLLLVVYRYSRSFELCVCVAICIHIGFRCKKEREREKERSLAGWLAEGSLFSALSQFAFFFYVWRERETDRQGSFLL